MLSHFEVKFNNQLIYISCGHYAENSYTSNIFTGALSEYKGVLNCKVYNYEEFLDENMDAFLSEAFFSMTKNMVSRRNRFMLYGKFGVEFFSTSELLYTDTKIRLRLIRVRPNFNMISDNPKVSLGNADCSLYIRHIAHTDDYHKKRLDKLAYSFVKFMYLWTLAKTFYIPARRSQLNKENILSINLVQQIATA